MSKAPTKTKRPEAVKPARPKKAAAKPKPRTEAPETVDVKARAALVALDAYLAALAPHMTTVQLKASRSVRAAVAAFDEVAGG